MLKLVLSLVFFTFLTLAGRPQNSFPYSIELEPVEIQGLPGLHSYAHGQVDGKWVIFGGRLDGLHARQPFNAFPASANNTSIFIVDPNVGTVETGSISGLATPVREQLQGTNMNFCQDGDVLYILGGYAYSISEDDHITFPRITAVNLPGVLDAVSNGLDLSPHFTWLDDDFFAVTGGHLNKLGNTFFLAGGHRFDGRYNPMNNPTFTQTYTNAIRSFEIQNNGGELEALNYSELIDPVHLRRRDYNLLPQVFEDGTHGFTIFSGVFQINADLPFLYPVDFTSSAIVPRTEFSQYLNHYHSPCVALYDGDSGETHSLIFGGMSQYYFEGEQLIEDDLVPFVSSIARVSRSSDGALTEYLLPVSFPQLQGAGAEFIMNWALPHTESELILLDEINEDEFVLGYIYGGISSTLLNPFSFNQTTATSADDVVYRVRLIRDETSVVSRVDVPADAGMIVYPNPSNGVFTIQIALDSSSEVYVLINDRSGRMLMNENLGIVEKGEHEFEVTLLDTTNVNSVIVTCVFDHRYYRSHQVILTN